MIALGVNILLRRLVGLDERASHVARDVRGDGAVGLARHWVNGA